MAGVIETRRQPPTALEQWPGDIDPVALHRLDKQRYPFVLESSAGAAAQGRYDLVFACPGEALTLADGCLTGPAATASADFLQALDSWFERESIAQPDLPLPFCGGWFLYLGYELAAQVEPRLDLPAAPAGLPTALAVRCRAAVIRDRQQKRVYLVAEDAADLAAMRRDLGRLRQTHPATVSVQALREEPPERYLEHVMAIRDYIRAGDVFQVNLSREWTGSLTPGADAVDVYHALRQANPAPFSGLMHWQDACLISSSPERLLSLNAGWADTRPIAGTRPRRGADERMTRELLANPKERAEHVMLIDLERNDLGRVCEYGSVTVNELMTLESYAHVHHIVSNVRGRLKPETGPGGALRAVFPGGTITGCPKVRCMEIIAELEAIGRGPYTGAFGYLGRDGRLDSNILIRTLHLQDRHISLRAGAGIVADSDPHKELEETRAKARGVLLSLGHRHE